MKLLLRSASFLFHPVWMPFAGTLIYFLVTPRFFPLEVIKAKLLAVAIITIFIPIVYVYMLRTLGKVKDHYLNELRERKWPLLLYAGLDFVVLKYVINTFDYPALYYFFAGVMASSVMALFLLFAKIKASLHMIGLGGLIGFLVLLSIHFHLNLVYSISFLVAITGLTATSRLFYGAHSYSELFTGLILGILPQAIAAIVWL
ncbi:hypothetical protein JRG66_08670 [Salinimicrobium tongyeongense]|uniref:PAP2 superfamily protein n=1 Tax=Salinimicrobium tongyeongense TaxID=2809707 RepID=A0ABY6NNA0_9FLAO|nr:hypothetical protein [Salinimicrobium tongyeongense]UZH54076.1 hypothetical protein JRG66_08670 [Salinimicrobium tongyeongense]